MALQDRLDRIRAGFEAEAPAEVLTVFHRVRDDLRADGIAERAVNEGQPAPDFTLASIEGGEVGLAALREKGPVILNFYRGHW